MGTVYVVIGTGGTLLGVYSDKQLVIDAWARMGVACDYDDEKELQLISPYGIVFATMYEYKIID